MYCITRLCMGYAFLALMLFTATASANWKKKAPPPPSEPIAIEYTTFSLSPYVTGGLLTGQAAERIDETFHKAVYGGGMRLEYMASPTVRFDSGLEALFAQVAASSFAKGNGISYSVGAIVMFTPHHRSSFYGRGELGWVNLNASKLSEDPGTHLFMRIALGQSYYSSSTRMVRFEIYYNTIRTNDIGAYPYVGTIDFNTNHVGFALGMSFGL